MKSCVAAMGKIRQVLRQRLEGMEEDPPEQLSREACAGNAVLIENGHESGV